MAIQLPNPGLGDGQTGDNEYVMWTKVKDNFSNTTHAASRLVGLSAENLPAVKDSHKAAFGAETITVNTTTNADDFEIGRRFTNTQVGNSLGMPYNTGAGGVLWNVETKSLNETGTWLLQSATERFTADTFYRTKVAGNWSTWVPSSKNTRNYTVTTQANPNVTVTEDGTLMRSTSSMKYKELIKHLELSADDYEKAMQVNPIVYRSKCDPDPSNWHYLSFSAEELGEYDPALTFWQTYETDPETGEQVELEEKEAEGINLNAICAVLHATNIYQDKKLKELEQRLKVLEQTDESIE